MKILEIAYKKIYKKDPPYYYKYSLLKMISKPIRKYFTNAVAPYCPFNCIRILIYKLCGFKIGKKVFIGMRCYLDDKHYDKIIIGNHVTISYGVFFACHGYCQTASTITIKDSAYIGMRSSIISKNSESETDGIVIGENVIVGAATLVNKDIPDNKKAVGVPCRIL